jgi:hypothetical protein
MFSRRAISMILTATIGLGPLAGCENLPGNEKEQGTVIGGVGGAAAGAALYKKNRLLGGLVGGALGAGGGYLIGANWDKIKGNKKEEATRANDEAQRNPVKASDVEKAKTADVNGDGFVTLDEVVAMHDAGVSKKEQIRRLEKTGQYFELSTEQEQYLKDHGVSDDVVATMRTMNQDVREAADKSTANGGSSMGNDPVGKTQ